MAATITFRTDPQIDAELAELTPPDDPDIDRSTVIRDAIHAAVRLRRRERLREEALRVASDPDDLAEIAAVQREMDDLRAW